MVKAEEEKKRTTEEDVRDHLRGFARTIPAFLMAYGDDSTTIDNFEINIDEATFEELTGITKDEFRKLRDGFEYVDDDGTTKRVPGLFDKVVFNASVREFFATKRRLSNYFDESFTEDIFDYIPPQKTNQIFTPKRVAKMMVDMIEKENPGIFSDSSIRFLDPYVKSGLYVAEVARRLFSGLKEQIPDPDERIKWILENQVYAIAPSNIIYNIVRNYIYPPNLAISTKNLAELDLMEHADSESDFNKKAIEAFGGVQMKFDVIVGNPPYQKPMDQTSDAPIYHLFMDCAYQLADKVCFITPARFLFNAGKTPKAWNEKMLNDRHLKVLFYEQDASKVFPGTSFAGGVAITYRDANKKLGPIRVFVGHSQLKSILDKVLHAEFTSFDRLVFAPESYRFTEKLHEENPDAKDKLSRGAHV
jgi:type I restriction-modification system DNA methylase subunit